MQFISDSRQAQLAIPAAILISSALVVPGNVLPVLAGLLADNYHLDEQRIGYLLSANTTVALAVSASAPWWIARASLRWLVPLVMAVLSGAYLSLALVPGYGALLLLEMLIGAGAGTIASICYTVMAQHADAARAWGVKVTLDILLASAFVKFVPGGHLLWFTAALAVVLLVAGGLGLLLPQRAAYRIRAAGAEVSPVSLRLAPPGAWLALLVLILFSIGAAGVWAFIQRLELRAGIGAADATDIFALGLLLGIGGAVAAALLGNRLGRVVPPTLMGALLVWCVHVMATTHLTTAFTLALIGLNATWSFYLPYMMGLIAVRDTTQRLSSLVNAALTIGSIIGPTLAGTLIHASGYPLAMAVQAGLIVAGVVLYVPVALRAAPRPAAP